MEYTIDEFDAYDIKLLAHTEKGWLTYYNCEWNLYLRIGSKYGLHKLIEHHLVLGENLYRFEVNISEEEEQELENGLDYDHPLVQDVSQRIVDKVLK